MQTKPYQQKKLKNMQNSIPPKQNLNRSINPQPIPPIRLAQRPLRLLSCKPHLHNPIDRFIRCILMRG